MDDKKVVLMMALFVCSMFVLSSKLLTPATINLIIQGESTYIEEIPNLYTFVDCIIIAISSFTLGISVFYLLLPREESAEIPAEVLKDASQSLPQEKIVDFLKILKGNEQRIVKELFENGEMNQAELSVRTNIPKSTLSRILGDLERRGLIIRYVYGMSKMVKLSSELK